MDDLCSYVDVFHGSGRIDLPEPEGIAKAWYFIKAICGNTHPAACLPFGRLSAGCYCAGYPTGYGNHRGNYSPDSLRTFGDKMRCLGFSHLHQSGTGAIDIYYNYAVTTPFYGDIYDSARFFNMKDEVAKPGYYTVRLEESDIKCELTVSNLAAVHRYTFGEKGGQVAVDLSNDGFLSNDPKQRGYSEKTEIRLVGSNAFEAEVVMQGLPLYIYGICESASDIVLWRDYLPLRKETELSLGKVLDNYGVSFTLPDKGTYEMKLSISAKSIEKARRDALSESRGFDAVAADACKKWNDVLSAIEIDAPTERDRRIFYSNMYHSLVKPSDWSGENFVGDGDDFVTDFATMWDIYKTQLPLLFTLYPEISRKILNTFFSFCESEGHFPHTLTLSKHYKNSHSSQARMLAEHSICDAFYRGIGADYKRALKAAEKDLFSRHYDDFHNGSIKRATHVVDVAEGCAAMAEAARRMGADAGVFERYKDCWQDVFDTKTGLMTEESDYYEGSEWNYSFRLMSDMEKRIEIAGGRERFAALLDRFFGYTSPGDTSARFEGFNNESDMEAPYAYHYAGRHDRLCEVLDAGRRYMFSDGRGGLPGNNDSGGLSSLYVWNVCGIFPVSGQDLMIIGSPYMKKTVFHLHNGRTFTVRREGEGIYVRRAVLDGNELSDLSFSAERMMQGGELVLLMSSES